YLLNITLIGARIVALISFFFSSRRRHTRSKRDWSSDVCSSDLTSKSLLKLGVHLPLTNPMRCLSNMHWREIVALPHPVSYPSPVGGNTWLPQVHPPTLESGL